MRSYTVMVITDQFLDVGTGFRLGGWNRTDGRGGGSRRLGHDEVNVNVGCPSDRVQSGAFGALMREPETVAVWSRRWSSR